VSLHKTTLHRNDSCDSLLARPGDGKLCFWSAFCLPEAINGSTFPKLRSGIKAGIKALSYKGGHS